MNKGVNFMFDMNFWGWVNNYEERCAEAYREVCRNPEKYHQILRKYELTESDVPYPTSTFAF